MKKRNQIENMLFGDFLDGPADEQLDGQIIYDVYSKIAENLDPGSAWNHFIRVIGDQLIANLVDFNEE